MQTLVFLTEVGTVTGAMDYSEKLDVLISYTSQLADASVWCVGFLLFFVVVVLCYFAYRFFRIFF